MNFDIVNIYLLVREIGYGKITSFLLKTYLRI